MSDASTDNMMDCSGKPDKCPPHVLEHGSEFSGGVIFEHIPQAMVDPQSLRERDGLFAAQTVKEARDFLRAKATGVHRTLSAAASKLVGLWTGPRSSSRSWADAVLRRVGPYKEGLPFGRYEPREIVPWGQFPEGADMYGTVYPWNELVLGHGHQIDKALRPHVMLLYYKTGEPKENILVKIEGMLVPAKREHFAKELMAEAVFSESGVSP